MEYKYKGINDTGKVVKGIIKGKSQWEAIEALRVKGISCICCESEKEGEKDSIQGKISHKDLALICKTLKNNMKSGIPITTSLNLAVKHIRKKQLIRILQRLLNYIEEGESLSEALYKFDNFFPRFFTSMVVIGEESGNLEGVFSKMETYFTNENKRKKTLINIAIYPLIIFTSAAIGAFVIITKFMPSFFSNMKIDVNEVPFITRFYMNLGKIFISLEYFLIPLILIGALIVVFLYKKAIKSGFIDRFKYTSFFTRRIYIKSFSCRFTMALHMTLSCGIDIKSAFQLLEKSEGSQFIKERYGKAREEIEKGTVLSQVISGFQLFSEEFLVSILLCEESGNLEELLFQTNEILEEELKSSVEFFMKMLEPMLILLAGLFLLSVYVAIIVPIYSIYSN